MNRSMLIFFITLMFFQLSLAQEKLYLQFEYMKVSEEQYGAYQETENFWEKIHKESAMNGDIAGWDLWSLQPGGEEQGFQYVTVTLFNDPAAMMSGVSWQNLVKNAQKAYPEMTKDEINDKIVNSSKTRDLAVRVYMEQIAATKGDFDMKPGTVASFDLMNTSFAQRGEYEKAEIEIFKPIHQKMVDEGLKGLWGLQRAMLPIGSDVYASHMTVNMYKDYEQFFKSREHGFGSPSESEWADMAKGLETREMKWVYMATLQKMVRK